MTSGFVIVSEPEKLKYPYIESLKSFLPICDELIAVCNSIEKFQDGSVEKIKREVPEIKIVGGLFDYPKMGWMSQGVMRTNGYYASTGDIVLMFDADDILHENMIDILRDKINKFSESGEYYAFWRRYKFRQREHWTLQCKYPGIFNKKIMGNNFNFYGAYLAEGNWSMIPEKHRRGIDLDFYLYGYERLWEDKKTLEYNLLNSKLVNFPEGAVNKDLTDKEYIENWVNGTRMKIGNEGQYMSINEQPKIIQEKLKSITKEQFGFDNFKGVEL